MDRGHAEIEVLFNLFNKKYANIFSKYKGIDCPDSLIEERDIALKNLVHSYSIKLNKIKKKYKIKDF